MFLSLYKSHVLHLLLLGSFTSGVFLLDNSLDNTDSNGLSHITDGETAERGVVGEFLDNHGLGGLHGHHAGITVLDKLGVDLHGLSGTAIHLLINILELGGDVGSVAIQHGAVSILDLTRVGHDNDLGLEGVASLGGILGVVGSNETSLDLLDGDVLAVESNVVTGHGLLEGLVVHLDGLDFSGEASGGEAHGHAGLDDTGLDTAHGHSADTTDLVNILKGKAEGLVSGSLGGRHIVKSLKEGGSLVPGHVVGLVDHVVTDPTRDGHEGNLGGLVSDLLEVLGNFLLDIVVSGLGVLARVHLVEGNDHLLDTKGKGEKGVLSGLAFSGPTTLETTGGGVDDKHGNISLRSSGNHVLDEITMAGGINNGERELGGLELPEGNINGDTTFTLGLEVIKNPSVLEGLLAHFGGFLLELLDSSLVDTSALVDQVTSGGGLSGIDVSDDNNTDVNLLLGHVYLK